jgi:hypothetical protein
MTAQPDPPSIGRQPELRKRPRRVKSQAQSVFEKGQALRSSRVQAR